MAAASNISFGAPEAAERFGIAGAMRRLGEFFRDFGAVVRASREAERLLDCSDAELARRGLRRSDVVPHVFERYLDRA